MKATALILLLSVFLFGIAPAETIADDPQNDVPVELIAFIAKPTDSSMLVEWMTASETNNDYFTLERSKDGVAWETVCMLAGAVNSFDIVHYMCVDEQPYAGKSFYRLIETDINKQNTYSRIISVDTDQLMQAAQNLPSTDFILVVSPTEMNEVHVYSKLEPQLAPGFNCKETDVSVKTKATAKKAKLSVASY